MSLGIVTALGAEAKTLTPSTGEVGEIVPLAPDVLLIQAGVGPQQTHRAGEKLLAAGASALLSWGCAGALDTKLKAGDLLLPGKVKSAESDRAIPIHLAWREQLWRHLSPLTRVHSAMLVSIPHPVLTPAAKRALAIRTGASAVDMESAALGGVAAAAKAPFIVIRAVADGAQVTVPAWLLACIDAAGTPRMYQLLSGLVRHPWDLAALLRLALGLQAAMATLRSVARRTDAVVPGY